MRFTEQEDNSRINELISNLIIFHKRYSFIFMVIFYNRKASKLLAVKINSHLLLMFVCFLRFTDEILNFRSIIVFVNIKYLKFYIFTSRPGNFAFYRGHKKCS